MHSFDQFIVETLKCKDIIKHFNFSGTLEENEKALNNIKRLKDSDCETLLQLYCCIWDFVLKNFCKSNNYTVVNQEEKRKICKELQTLLEGIIEKIFILDCITPNCFKG
jgi:hypothetical protein